MAEGLALQSQAAAGLAAQETDAASAKRLVLESRWAYGGKIPMVLGPSGSDGVGSNLYACPVLSFSFLNPGGPLPGV